MDGRLFNHVLTEPEQDVGYLAGTTRLGTPFVVSEAALN